MKRGKLLVAMVVAGVMALPGFGEVTVFSEDFTGTTGADISTLGWTQTEGSSFGHAIIADPEIRAGQGQYAIGDYTTGWETLAYEKTIPTYTVGAGETLEAIISTVAGHGAFGAWIEFYTDDNFKWQMGYANWGYGLKAWGSIYRPDTGLTRDYMKYPITESDVDLKLVTQPGSEGQPGVTLFYYADASTGWEWTEIPVTTPEVYAGYAMWNISKIKILLYNEYLGTSASPMMDAIKVSVTGSLPGPVTVQGTVVLDGYAGDYSGVGVTVELRNISGPIRTEKMLLGGDGRFVVSNVDPGTYDVAVKSACWLQRVVAGVDATASVDLGTLTLVSGDVDGDNEITTSDLASVLFSMDQMGDP